MKKLSLFPLIFLLASCTTTDSMSDENSQAESSANEPYMSSEVEQEFGQAFEHASEMQLFLYEDQSTVTFVGEGNEFASYTIQATWLNENYVRYEQDNGGVILAKYYRVVADGIYLVEQVADETQAKTVAELEQLPVISTILIPPVTVGTTFDGWTIVAIDASYTSPYEQFEKVVVLEKETDQVKERQYFVAGIGAIAYEFESVDENGEVSIITSKLAAITY